tara:strand:+ start:766 stop:1722 length:957 start_codon:yes stop_codon:yes gene_type:complete
MNDIKTRIINLKPTLKPDSLNLYLRNLKIIFQYINKTDELPENINFLNNTKEVLDYLQTRTQSTQKTYFTSIIVATQAYKNKELYQVYNPPYEILTTKLKAIAQSQIKSQNEEENWVSIKKLKSVLNKYKKELTTSGVFNLESKITPYNFKLLQKYVVGMLYIGSPDNPPVRNDYSNMKVISKLHYNKLSPAQKIEMNYLVITGKNKKKFILNKYKTDKVYGEKIIAVSAPVNKILNVWLHYNKNDFLLLNNRKEPLSDNGLTKLLQSVFAPTGKNISVSMLRHIFITEKFPADLDKKKELANLMLHSVGLQNEYAKM